MNSSNMNQPVQYESTSPELSTSFVLFKQLERISLCLSLSLFLNPDNLTGEDLNDQLACKLHCPNCPIYCTRSRQVKSHPNKRQQAPKPLLSISLLISLSPRNGFRLGHPKPLLANHRTPRWHHHAPFRASVTSQPQPAGSLQRPPLEPFPWHLPPPLPPHRCCLPRPEAPCSSLLPWRRLRALLPFGRFLSRLL